MADMSNDANVLPLSHDWNSTVRLLWSLKLKLECILCEIDTVDVQSSPATRLFDVPLYKGYSNRRPIGWSKKRIPSFIFVITSVIQHRF